MVYLFIVFLYRYTYIVYNIFYRDTFTLYEICFSKNNREYKGNLSLIKEYKYSLMIQDNQFEHFHLCLVPTYHTSLLHREVVFLYIRAILGEMN